MRISERASRPQRNSGVGADTPTPDHDKIALWAERNGYRIVQQVYEGKVEKWYRPEWEYAILSRGRVKYVIGFIDLRIAVDVANVFPGDAERKIVSRGDLLLELKPKIESLGAVIRQINLYRQYEEAVYPQMKPEWGVVSPDRQFSATFERQGIHFIECPALDDLTSLGMEIDEVPF